jgi:membrane protease YdiL (CAAX protease family)
MDITAVVPHSTLVYSSAAISAAATGAYFLYRKLFNKSETPTEDDQIKHELITFTGLTTTATCAMTSAVLYFIRKGDLDSPQFNGTQLLLSMGCMLVPATVAKGIEWYYKQDGQEERESSIWKVLKHAYTNKTAYGGVLLITALAVDTIFISGMLPGNSFSLKSEYLCERIKNLIPYEQRTQALNSLQNIDLASFIPKSLASALLGGLTINVILAYMEERGWRDFMYKRVNRLLGKESIVRHSLLVGGAWGLFHAPLIMCGHNYPTHWFAGVDQFILACILYSPVFKYIVDRAQEEEDEKHGIDSVFIGGMVAAMLHGIMNATGGVTLMFVKGGSDLSNGAAGWAGMAAFAVADLALLYHARNKKE